MVADGFTNLEVTNTIAIHRGNTSKIVYSMIVDLVIKGCEIVREIEPDKSLPDFQSHGHESVGCTVKLYLAQDIWCSDQFPIQPIRPGMIAALDCPFQLS
jgi:hypothetical protein